MSSLTWGDTVRVKADASAELRPGRLAAVCGMREVETQEQANEFGSAIGTMLYLVEFADGGSLEIPGDSLEVVNDEE